MVSIVLSFGSVFLVFGLILSFGEIFSNFLRHCRFMEEMQARNRVAEKVSESGELKRPSSFRRPTSSYVRTQYTEEEKEEILQRNLLLNKPRLVESAPIKRKGNPIF